MNHANISRNHDLILCIYVLNFDVGHVHGSTYLHNKLHILAFLGEGATSHDVDHIIIGQVRVVPPHDEVVRCSEVGIIPADDVDRCISKAIHTTVSYEKHRGEGDGQFTLVIPFSAVSYKLS